MTSRDLSQYDRAFIKSETKAALKIYQQDDCEGITDLV